VTSMAILERDCVIAGGGPAGMILGYLLARAGLEVTVLEKHEDFLRDFRGDTIHPSTITLLRELGLKDEFLQLPVNRVDTLDAVVDGTRLTLVDFSTLPKPDNFLVFAPQWDFLSFLVREAAALPGFELLMSTEAIGLTKTYGTVTGVTAVGPDGPVEIRATLTVAADGRFSTLRDEAGFTPVELGVPIDVLWFDLPKPPNPPPTTLGYLSPNGFVVTIERGDHYQSGMIIRKGGLDALKAHGIDSLRRALVAISPVLEPVVGALTSFDEVKLLSVQLNRLTRWYRDGFICIGDAAHAMSPVMGVGINYAIQDAVALAREIAGPLARGTAPSSALHAVQERRIPPVEKMQRIQQFVHNRMEPTLQNAGGPVMPPVALRTLRALQPILRRVMARLVGRGFLPEHIDTATPPAQLR